MVLQARVVSEIISPIITARPLIVECSAAAGLGMTSPSGTAPTRPARLLVMHPILGHAGRHVAGNNSHIGVLIIVNWTLLLSEHDTRPN